MLEGEMSANSITRLDLRERLIFYSSTNFFALPKKQAELEKFEEIVFCIKLKETAFMDFSVQYDQFFKKLIFCGCKKYDIQNQQKIVEIPCGLYLFSQQNQFFHKDDCILEAIEQQKNGLWEKFKLNDILYIRYLLEKENWITQFFRPVL
jgi:hypothetical protein